jgi:hypothetical protein
MADDIAGDLNVFGSVNASTYYGDATQFSALAAPQLTSTQRDALTNPVQRFAYIQHQHRQNTGLCRWILDGHALDDKPTGYTAGTAQGRP